MMCTSITGATMPIWPRARKVFANASASSRGRVTNRRMIACSLEAREFSTRAIANLSRRIFAGGEGAGARMFVSGVFAMDLARCGPGIAPVERQDFAAKEKVGAFHFSETRNGRAAGAVKRGEEAALAGNGEMGLRVVDRRDQPVGRVILVADLDADGPLTERWQPLGRIQNLAVRQSKLQPRHAGARQHDRIGFAAGELQQPGLDIAPQGHDFEIGPQPQGLRLTAHRTGAKP